MITTKTRIAAAIIMGALIIISSIAIIANPGGNARGDESTTVIEETTVENRSDKTLKKIKKETVKETTKVEETTIETTEVPVEVYVEPEPVPQYTPTPEPVATEPPATEPPQTEPPVEQMPIGYLCYSDQDAIDIAKVMYLEARGIGSDTEKACIAWTILNRVDNFGGTVYSTIRQPNQFAFYESTPVWDNLYSLAHDVLSRWSREKAGETNVGRVLPRDYMWYYGDGYHNYFRNAAGTTWNYSWGSPYGS